MNSIFVTVLSQFLVTGVFLLFVSQPILAFSADTLQVSSVGVKNQVVVGAQTTIDSLTNITGSHVRGTIVQKGINNSVRINKTKAEACSSGTNHTNSTTPTFPNDKKSGPAGNTINVQQTGRNNSVKINTR